MSRIPRAPYTGPADFAPGTPKRVVACNERIRRFVAKMNAERALECRTVRCTDCSASFVVLAGDTQALCACGHDFTIEVAQ